jgi:hypothetical protein
MELSEAELERLRRSGIRLDAEGRFIHEGDEVRHAGLRAALWRWLDRNPDGRYVLRLDVRRFVYLDVDDAPQVVRSLRWEGGCALALLGDGSEEPLALATVRLGDPGPAYATVKNGRFTARILPAAWAVLAERIVEDESGVAWLEMDGGRVRLGPVSA